MLGIKLQTSARSASVLTAICPALGKLVPVWHSYDNWADVNGVSRRKYRSMAGWNSTPDLCHSLKSTPFGQLSSHRGVQLCFDQFAVTEGLMLNWSLNRMKPTSKHWPESSLKLEPQRQREGGRDGWTVGWTDRQTTFGPDKWNGDREIGVRRSKFEQSILTCICISTWKTEAGGLQVQGQSGLHNKTLYHYFENTYQTNIVWYQNQTVQTNVQAICWYCDEHRFLIKC